MTKTQYFHEVFTQIFFDNFSREIKVVNNLNSPKPQHFHEFFTQKNRQFSREIKVEFLDKKRRFRTVCKRKNKNHFKDSQFSLFFLHVCFQIVFINLQVSSIMTKGGANPGRLSYSSQSRYISHFHTSLEFELISS